MQDINLASRAAHEVFKRMEWSWWNNSNPSEEDIKQLYEELLGKLKREHGSRVHSGRLMVVYLDYTGVGEIEFYIGPIPY